MKASIFYRRILILSLVLLCSNCSEEKKAESSQNDQLPNIIWLVAEDQSPEWFPMYGDGTISLPNLESLTEDGILFTNAVSPVPVCAPARSALITGMYPTTLGTHNMRTYNAYANGENEPTIGIPSYSPIVPDGVKMFTEYLRKKGYYTANGPKEDYNFEKTDGAWDESSGDRHWRKRKEGQPFFTVFNFSVCHESQIWNRANDSLFVEPSKVNVPPYFPDTEIVRHDLAVNYSNLKRLDDQIGNVLAQLKSDGLYEETIIFFYGDHGGPFPRYKRALYDTGLKVPMVIKLSGNKKSGTTDDRLISFIDLAPTILSLARIEPPKVMQGKAQLGSFAENQNKKYTYHSSDRFDEFYDRLRAVRSKRYKYIKSFDTTISHAIPVSYREQMPMMAELRKLYGENKLTNEQALWLQPNKPTEELYDLVKDPYELNNLALRPEIQDTLFHYRNLLETWMKKTNDLGSVPESDLMTKWIPDGLQPQLRPLEVEIKDDLIALFSKKRDASIVWKLPHDSIWNIYSEPIKVSIPFVAKAERIGYRDSELFENEID